MTAKHRGKKNKHNHEDFNHLIHESSEPEARGGNQNVLLLISFLMIVIGGATGTWFCFQQHQSITYLADNFMGMQMKMVTLQSFQEEIRQTNEKHSTSDFELRLNTLEESYTLAQKQVVMALAMAEQLKTLDLPAQVLSLHTEMNAQLAEIQQATVSTEQLTQLQAMLKGKSEEFEAVRLQVEGLAGLSTELAQSVEGLTGSLAERAGLLGTLSATMEGQASDLLGVKEQLSANKAQLEASTAEITSVRELIETVQSQSAQQAREGQQSLQEQNSVAHSLHSELHAQMEVVQKQVARLEGGGQADEPSEEVEEEAASAEEEQAAPAEDVGEKEAAHLDGKSVVQEYSAVTEEQTASAEEEGVEEEQEDLAEAAPEEVVEEVQAVENVEEQAEEEDSEAEDEQEEEQAVEEEEEQLEEDEASSEEEL
ncbi:protein Ycf2 isoform X2 [Oncorhynchus mykiss]|uniref:protein Ycf2 isoform X2 n=1 Tax=Oncorhynchus mykiss TaxID=8022 RepID=UPI000B4EBF2C|nr:protein Ycf2 isoform X2 [Oncorhynchus mykiss]